MFASELNDPICHSDECQIGSFSSEATKCAMQLKMKYDLTRYVNTSLCVYTGLFYRNIYNNNSKDIVMS